MFGLGKIFKDKKSDNDTILRQLLETDMTLETARLLMIQMQKKKLRSVIVDLLSPMEKPFFLSKQETIVLVVGMNGSGKTTTIGKLALYFHDRVSIFASADTFRAAATEQLDTWAKLANAQLIAGKPGTDPSSVAFRACQLAQKRSIIWIDTAGRLHNKINLMEELAKINRAISKSSGKNAHHILLVLDMSIGKNVLLQVSAFQEFVPLSGLILTKTDGTAKGGILLSLATQFNNLPVYFVGTGGGGNDIIPFSAESFADRLSYSE